MKNQNYYSFKILIDELLGNIKFLQSSINKQIKYKIYFSQINTYFSNKKNV